MKQVKSLNKWNVITAGLFAISFIGCGVSAHEANFSQYPVLDLPDIPETSTINFEIYDAHITWYRSSSYDSSSDYQSGGHGFIEEGPEHPVSAVMDLRPKSSGHDWFRDNPFARHGKATGEVLYYQALIKVLERAKLETDEEISELNKKTYTTYIIPDQSSTYSPLYNDKIFDKYLDSIVSDAQKAGETGVKSLIPTPEGEFLDTITEGAYGSVSQINTIAQMGYYIQNISKTSAKMLEETRKTPDEIGKTSKATPTTRKVSKTNPQIEHKIKTLKSLSSSLERKMNDTTLDYNTYCLINEGHYPNVTSIEVANSFDEKINDLRFVSQSDKAIIILLATNEKNPFTEKDHFYKIKDMYGTRDNSKGIEEAILDFYLNKYGYSLPSGFDFVEIPVTEEKKQNIIKIKEIAKNNMETESSLPDNKYRAKLEKVNYWYGQVSSKENIIVVPSELSRNVKLLTSDEFKDYTDYLEDSSIISGKADNLNKTIDENYGVLTGLVFKGDYEKQRAELDKVEKTLDNFEPGEANEIIASVENDLGDVKENSDYKVLRFIELTPNHIDNIRHTLFPTQEDKMKKLKERYGEDIEISGIYNGVEEKSKGKRCIGVGGFTITAYQNFYGKEFYLDDGVAERIVVHGENGTIYCDRNDVVIEGYNWGDLPNGDDVEIPKIESKIIRI